MNILVTGAGGMVGSHMVELLYKRGDNVIGIWHKNKKNVEQIILPVTFFQSDLRYGGWLMKLLWTICHNKYIISLHNLIPQFHG